MGSVKHEGITIDGKAIRLHIDHGQISSIEAIPDDNSLPYLLPPLVDLQHNGALGIYYTTLEELGEEEAQKSLCSIAALLREHGVGRCLLTFPTYPYEDLITTTKIFKKLVDQDDSLARIYFSIFHEGVFISPLPGWRGAHNPDWVLEPDYELFKKLDAACEGMVSLVNVAPESRGAVPFIQAAKKDGKIVSLGHCAPDTATIDAAIDAGASMITHLGNGASPEIHRFKNPFWGFLSRDELRAGIILDGHHLPRELVDVIQRCKGMEGFFPVSDASGYSGREVGTHESFGGRKIVIEDNGFMHLENSELLCGAWHQLDRAVTYLVENFGWSFLDAWRQCSLHPAGIMGIELPRIEVGQRAEFVIARMEGELKIENYIGA